jgi:hypothetical protein
VVGELLSQVFAKASCKSARSGYKECSHTLVTVLLSNGNDIETKRNDFLIKGVFSVSKRNEPACSRTLKDQSKENIFMSMLCRIEVNTNWVGPKLSRIEQK